MSLQDFVISVGTLELLSLLVVLLATTARGKRSPRLRLGPELGVEPELAERNLRDHSPPANAARLASSHARAVAAATPYLSRPGKTMSSSSVKTSHQSV